MDNLKSFFLHVNSPELYFIFKIIWEIAQYNSKKLIMENFFFRLFPKKNIVNQAEMYF